MSVLELRQIGDPVLRSPASQVPLGGDAAQPRITKLVDDMFATMEQANGIGLAAPQVGVSLQIFTWDVAGSRGAVINPQLELSGEPDFVAREDDQGDGLLREGCLSVPGGIYAPVARYPQVVLTGSTPDGKPIRVQAEGILAVCFQHELDHLDGKLFLDRLTGEHKKQAFRALRSGSVAA